MHGVEIAIFDTLLNAFKETVGLNEFVLVFRGG
jgi:hypothetical protein